MMQTLVSTTLADDLCYALKIPPLLFLFVLD